MRPGIKKHKHKEPTKFREQDYKPEEQILAVNSEIKKLHKENHQEAPEFNSDLYTEHQIDKRKHMLVTPRVVDTVKQKVEDYII